MKDPAMTPEEAADAARPHLSLQLIRFRCSFGAKSDVSDIEVPTCLLLSPPFTGTCNDLMLRSGCEDLEEGTLRSLSPEVDCQWATVEPWPLLGADRSTTSRCTSLLSGDHARWGQELRRCA